MQVLLISDGAEKPAELDHSVGRKKDLLGIKLPGLSLSRGVGKGMGQGEEQMAEKQAGFI